MECLLFRAPLMLTYGLIVNHRCFCFFEKMRHPQVVGAARNFIILAGVNRIFGILSD